MVKAMVERPPTVAAVLALLKSAVNKKANIMIVKPNWSIRMKVMRKKVVLVNTRKLIKRLPRREVMMMREAYTMNQDNQKTESLRPTIFNVSLILFSFSSTMTVSMGDMNIDIDIVMYSGTIDLNTVITVPE